MEIGEHVKRVVFEPIDIEPIIVEPVPLPEKIPQEAELADAK